MKLFGYFTDSSQTEPEFDPGLDIDCPACHFPLQAPMETISLMLEGDDRSYFYRMHKACSEKLSPELETEIDSLIIDAVALAKRNTN